MAISKVKLAILTKSAFRDGCAAGRVVARSIIDWYSAKQPS